MKEFLKKKWYIILGLILLIASVVVSVILYIKLDECSNKKCEECETCEEVKCEEKEEIESEEDDEEKPQLPSEDETYSFVSIVKADKFGVLYDYNESITDRYKALKNGYLTGDWYIEELKDTKFIGTAGVNVDIGPANILALSESGEIYQISTLFDESDASYHKLNTNISGKITKMENMVISPEDHGIPFYLDVPVLTVNDNKCVLNEEYNGVDVVYTCDQSLEAYYKETPIFTVGHYAHTDGIGLDYTEVYNNYLIKFDESDKFITNAYNSKAINVMYTIYTVDEENNEVLYIVSADDKLYIIDSVDNTKIDAYGDIEKVDYIEQDIEGSIYAKAKQIKITLTSGEILEFEQN